MSIVVNGTETPATERTTVADVVEGLGHDPALPGVAAAIDGVVVPRARWAQTVVPDGSRVEVLTAVQGG